MIMSRTKNILGSAEGVAAVLFNRGWLGASDSTIVTGLPFADF
jgi:hypothetical protein